METTREAMREANPTPANVGLALREGSFLCLPEFPAEVKVTQLLLGATHANPKLCGRNASGEAAAGRKRAARRSAFMAAPSQYGRPLSGAVVRLEHSY